MTQFLLMLKGSIAWRVQGMKKNPMTCEEFVVDSLGAFRDGDLTSADRIRAQKHLTSCNKCSAYLRGYERTIELAKKTHSNSAVSAVLPENLVRRIMAAQRRA
jgi:anti-sigma factor RsiW